jgi:hypothetical protein
MLTGLSSVSLVVAPTAQGGRYVCATFFSCPDRKLSLADHLKFLTEGRSGSPIDYDSMCFEPPTGSAVDTIRRDHVHALVGYLTR